MYEPDAHNRLVACGLRPSMQRLAIMRYLIQHATHPTIEDIYRDLKGEIPTLSRTTLYNTLRLFAENKAAQMITIDDHHVCYDGDMRPHVHFLCKNCGKVIDLFDIPAPSCDDVKEVCGHRVDDVQLYYRGICSECQEKNKVVG